MAPRLLFIFGTRPESIKIAPVVEELRVLGIEPVLICTGQHTSLLEGTPAETVLADSRSLKLPSDGAVFSWVQRAKAALAWGFEPSDHVVVLGDTMSAFAGASAAADLKCTLHHIEAGVRSHAHEPWPEEEFRKAISGLADFHYCATEANADNLIEEMIPPEGGPESVFVTGNPVVTSLLNLGLVPCKAAKPPTILITLHRRESRESEEFPEILNSLFWSIGRFPEVRFLWPVHPAMPGIALRAGKPDNLKLVPPLSYTDFVVRLSTALGLFTDSGGAVEEAATLGVPTVIFRRHNDRPEAVEAGIARRFSPEIGMILAAISPLAKKRIKRIPHAIYGDRKSAFRIAEHIQKVLL